MNDDKLTPTPGWMAEYMRGTGYKEFATGVLPPVDSQGGAGTSVAIAVPMLWQKGDSTTTWEQVVRAGLSLRDKVIDAWQKDSRGLSFEQFVRHALEAASVPVAKRFWEKSEFWIATLGVGGPFSFIVTAVASGSETLPHPWDKILMGVCTGVMGLASIAYKMIRTEDKVQQALLTPPPPLNGTSGP